jgi:hypothetical protein
MGRHRESLREPMSPAGRAPTPFPQYGSETRIRRFQAM